MGFSYDGYSLTHSLWQSRGPGLALQKPERGKKFSLPV